MHRGKTSSVWESIHKTTGNRFAAKVFERRYLSETQDHEAQQEASVLQQLDQLAPGTIHLIDWFDEPTHLYLVTDYASEDLLHRIHKRGPLTEGQAQKLARSLVMGLKHVHDCDICHRNVRPENILLEDVEDGPALLADFGAAVCMAYDADGERFMLTERCGTNAYTAPEILQRHPYDTQADMWSVGVVLYYAMVGVRPFEDKDSKVLFQRIVKADYRFDPQMWYKCSRSAKRFISSLLHVDPQVRMTADEALDHPWISDVGSATSNRRADSVSAMSPAQTLSSSPPTKKFKSKRLSKVWKAFARPGNKRQQEQVVEDDTQSMTSRTISLLSSDAAANNNRTSPQT